jgi:hypothetical protein
MADKKALQGNMDVDYVISYHFADVAKAQAQTELEMLVKAIVRTGLQVEVRNGDKCSLLLFIKAADPQRFNNVVYKSRYIQLTPQTEGYSNVLPGSKIGSMVFDPPSLTVRPIKPLQATRSPMLNGTVLSINYSQTLPKKVEPV